MSRYFNWGCTGTLHGKRGQAFLREILKALNAMPKKELIDWYLEQPEGVSALGCVGKVRGLDMSNIVFRNYDILAEVFEIPAPLIAKVMYENDKEDVTYEDRWLRMRAWLKSQIVEKDEVTGAARQFRGFKNRYGTYE